MFIAARRGPAQLSAEIEANMMARFDALLAPVMSTMTALAKAMQDITGCTIAPDKAKWLAREVPSRQFPRGSGGFSLFEFTDLAVCSASQWSLQPVAHEEYRRQ